MKWLIMAVVFCGVAHAQTIIRYDEPDPDKIRVEKLADDEVASLAKLSESRQKALDAYLSARDAYQKEKDHLESKYQAYQQQGDCNKPKIDVEWRGKFIIVEQYPTSGSNVFGGGCSIGGMFVATPSTTLTLNNSK